MIKPSKFFEIYEEKRKFRKLFTLNIVKGTQVYGEKLIRQKNSEFREWDEFKSKLASYIIKGGNQIGLKPGNKVLYLGASTGTTVSHVSDIVGRQGQVFAIDFAPRVLRELVFVCEDRQNIAPILADANDPDSFKDRILAPVDWLFQDVAQRDQVGIFLKNVNAFLKPKGYAFLALKARSVDVTKRPRDVFAEVQRELEKHMTLVDKKFLDPFQKDHCMFVCKKK